VKLNRGSIPLQQLYAPPPSKHVNVKGRSCGYIGSRIVGRVSFSFGDLKDSFSSGVLLRSSLGDDRLLFFPSVCGWQKVQVRIYLSLVSFGNFGLFSILCSFLHTWPSVQRLSLLRQWWRMWKLGNGQAVSSLLTSFLSFFFLVGKLILIDGVIVPCFGDVL